jgi:hypothetical protein
LNAIAIKSIGDKYNYKIFGGEHDFKRYKISL